MSDVIGTCRPLIRKALVTGARAVAPEVRNDSAITERALLQFIANHRGDRLKKLQRAAIDATLIASIVETAALIVQLIDDRKATLGNVRLALQQVLINVETFHSPAFAAKLDAIERFEDTDPADLPAA